MGMLDISIMQRYIRMCQDGWEQGWHERNGGNLTYRLTGDEVAEMRPFFNETPGPWVAMGVTGANLAGEYFISTGSGKYFRNVALDPEDSLCVVEINPAGDSYRIVWGLKNGGRPTSEFPSHFMNHSVRVAATGGACRVIYHAHPANVIALTYVLPLIVAFIFALVTLSSIMSPPKKLKCLCRHIPKRSYRCRSGSPGQAP